MVYDSVLHNQLNAAIMTAYITFLGDLTGAITVGANIVWTALLVLCLIYWLFVIIGAFEIETFDFDVDVDVDLDVDVDADVDVDTGDNPIAWIGFLKFLNLDAIPFMVFFTIFTLGGWATSVLATHYMGFSWLTSLIFLIPIIFVSLIISKVITTPLVPLFRGLNDEAKALDLTGADGRVVHGFEKGELSQASVKKNNEDLLVNIKIADESKLNKFDKGASVTMLRKIKEGELIAYEVISPDTLNLTH